MNEFSIQLHTQEGLAFFSFTRIYTTRGAIYFVCVKRRAMRYNFQMDKVNGQWWIVLEKSPPDWVFDCQEKLSMGIDAYEAE
jgi:hypothetical protein